VLLIPADVTNPKDAVVAVGKIVQQYGQLDILIANAGASTTVEHGKDARQLNR
jgi:NAD(P)-dependent dehydrogenase (short-subunit alcohol dehydrogenase family)